MATTEYIVTIADDLEYDDHHPTPEDIKGVIADWLSLAESAEIEVVYAATP